jgi:hypothetical protein
VQVTYKRCRASGGVDANDLDTPAFMPGQPGVCALSNVPKDPSILDRVNVGGADPGKGNIITMDRGPKEKYMAQDFYGALSWCKTDSDASTVAVTASAKASWTVPKRLRQSAWCITFVFSQENSCGRQPMFLKLQHRR